MDWPTAFINSHNLEDHSLTESDGRHSMLRIRPNRMANLENRIRTMARHFPRQWMLRCHKKRRSSIQKLLTATSTSPVRSQTAPLHTNLLQLHRVQPSIMQTHARLEQPAKTESALAGTHLLLNKHSKNASSTQIALMLDASSNIQRCRHAVTEVTARRQTASSLTARLNASSTLDQKQTACSSMPRVSNEGSSKTRSGQQIVPRRHVSERKFVDDSAPAEELIVPGTSDAGTASTATAEMVS